MLSILPNELICNIYSQLDSYSDYINLSQTCRHCYVVSRDSFLHRSLLQKFFSVEENKALIDSDNGDTFLQICDFIEAAKIKPRTNSILKVMEEQIGTDHFAKYPYKNPAIKSSILDIFRPKCEEVKDSLPSMVSATLATRHITCTGPRRIYYNVAMGVHKFRCIFYDLEKVVAFEDNKDLTVRYGSVQFKDEDIISDYSWSNIFSAKKNQTNNVVLPSPNVPTTDVTGGKLFISIPVISSTARKIPSHWKPCLLRTCQDCVLQTTIKKGALVKDQLFNYVFIYENQQDDSICIEFCTLGQSDRLIPRGYLLMKEHRIQWDPANAV